MSLVLKVKQMSGFEEPIQSNLDLYFFIFTLK